MIRTGQLTPLLLLILCFLSCVLIFRTNRAKLEISIHVDTQMHEVSRIIRAHKERIEHISSEQSNLIFRCADEHISYPSHASDELTEMLMTPNDDCANVTDIDAIIIVHTAANHFRRRHQYRRAYANYNITKPYRLKVVFLIGSVMDDILHLRLERENRDYGDTVVGAFLDTYHNLTLKAVMGFRWLATSCPNVKLLIKMDDDVIFNVRKFFTNYWRRVGSDMKKQSMHCAVWHRADVGRQGKWKVGKDLFSGSKYPFSYCAGFFLVLSPDLIQPIYYHGRSLSFFWIDDVFLYGMVPAAIKGVHFVQLAGEKRMLARDYSELQACRKRYGGDKCPMWAWLSSKDEDFDYEHTSLLSQALMSN